jgi:hypothetical protein
MINRKKAQWLDKVEGLAVRGRCSGRCTVALSAPTSALAFSNHHWDLDFSRTPIASARRSRVLHIIDGVTSEYLAVVPTRVDLLSHVVRVLVALRSKPGIIVSDNGIQQ